VRRTQHARARGRTRLCAGIAALLSVWRSQRQVAAQQQRRRARVCARGQQRRDGIRVARGGGGVTEALFQASAHVAHLRYHPRAYTARLLSFFRDSLLRHRRREQERRMGQQQQLNRLKSLLLTEK
jgi:hypothetical protein